MSRRPRAPLQLRVLGREPSIEPDLRIDAGETTRLLDPVPAVRPVALAPGLVGVSHALVPDVAPSPEIELAPVVDTLPATLVGAVFALRTVDLRFRLPVTEQAPRFVAESRGVATLRLPPSERSQPEAALIRRAAPMVLEEIGRPLLRTCLEALFRASGAPTADDLSLVGVYDRVPVGAIAGATATPRGLELRLRPGKGVRSGLLVVGRRRSTGALVTAEVTRDRAESDPQ
jgi:hypothetical protein